MQQALEQSVHQSTSKSNKGFINTHSDAMTCLLENLHQPTSKSNKGFINTHSDTMTCLLENINVDFFDYFQTMSSPTNFSIRNRLIHFSNATFAENSISESRTCDLLYGGIFCAERYFASSSIANNRNNEREHCAVFFTYLRNSFYKSDNERKHMCPNKCYPNLSNISMGLQRDLDGLHTGLEFSVLVHPTPDIESRSEQEYFVRNIMINELSVEEVHRVVDDDVLRVVDIDDHHKTRAVTCFIGKEHLGDLAFHKTLKRTRRVCLVIEKKSAKYEKIWDAIETCGDSDNTDILQIADSYIALEEYMNHGSKSIRDNTSSSHSHPEISGRLSSLNIPETRLVCSDQDNLNKCDILERSLIASDTQTIERQMSNCHKEIEYQTNDEIVNLKIKFKNKKNGNVNTFKHKLNKVCDHSNSNCPHSEYVRDKTGDVDTARMLTWLPLEQLPVPQVDLTVAFVFEPIDNIFTQMARDKTPGPEVTMRYELLRLCTLRNYPKENKPYIIRLAGAGFYYAAEGDEVVCYCCGLRRNSWTETDVPYTIHQRLSPRCSFLTRNYDVNVPVPNPDRPGSNRFLFLEEHVETSNNNSNATPVTAYVHNSRNISIEQLSEDCPSPNSSVAQHSYENLSRNILGNSSYNGSLVTIGVGNQQRSGNFVGSNSEARIAPTISQQSTTSSAVTTAKPKYPSYAVKSVRLSSFHGWPDNVGQTAEIMADAGFYFSGIGDAVRCFFCGIGLRHWTPEDNPWTEHARWSRQCVYVKMIKGEEYINLVHLAMHLTQDPEEQAGAECGAATNRIPIEDINNILLTSAAQSLLEMGYTPKIIKQAIEIILRETGRSGISSTHIMEKVLKLEDKANALALASELGQVCITQGNAATNNNQSTAPNAALQTTLSSQNVSRRTGSETQTRQTISNSSIQHGEQTASQAATQVQVQKSVESPVAQFAINTGPQSNNETNGTRIKDSKSLMAENKRMQEQTMCKVCMDKTVCIVFLPCGHLVTCAECAPAMRKCPICRTFVKGTVKAFMS